MPRSYYIWTIGCQMNKAESERLASYLEDLGYQSSLDVETADMIILNGCVVRQGAEDRIYNKIHSLKLIKISRPHVVIALTGCYVGPDTEKLKKKFPFVDHLFPAGEFPEWLGDYNLHRIIPVNPQVATYVPIMQGCDNFCSYCVVPYRRGRERSRPMEEIVAEVRELVKRGVKEVTLLGQNVDSYGRNLPGEPDLADLLHQLNPIDGLLRIRFLTNHPKDMKSKLIESMSKLNKVCEQINLPVQSGDDTILKAMRRGYTAEQYRDLVKQIRSAVPSISLSTDVIVGFPGETEEQYQNTYNLLSEIRFEMVHVSAYSPRPQTLASREMPDDVPLEVKKARKSKIDQLQAVIIGEVNHELKDQVVEILVERKEKDKWCGRTRGDKLVFFSSPQDFQSKLVDVLITNTTPWSLIGKPTSEITSI